MAKIVRKTAKVFASSAGGTGVAAFGSTAAGSTTYTTDPDAIQTTAFQNGLASGIIAGTKRLPVYEEINGVYNVATRQIAYILQEGVAEYDASTEYQVNSIVKKASTFELYGSLVNTNTGNALGSRADNANWKYLCDLSSLNFGALSGGYLNKIRNNSFLVSSRGTSGTITAGSPVYTLDGWILFAGSANITWSQSGTSGYPTTKSLTITGNTGVTNTQLYQRIESIVAGYIDGQQVTFQASITNNTGAAITPTLIVSHANAADNWGATTTDLSVSLQSIANGATTKVAYTYTAAANSFNGLQFTLDFGATLNSVAKNVIVSGVDVRVTPGVVTGLNNTPPPIEVIDISAEVVRCARYLPAFKSTGGTNNLIANGFYNATATISSISIPFPTPTRTAVTGIALSNISHFNVGGGVVNVVATASAAQSASLTASHVNFTTGTAGTAGQGCQLFFNNASGTLIFTGSEL